VAKKEHINKNGGPTANFEVAKCDGCGKLVVWAAIIDERGLATGGKIPLDPSPPVYAVAVTQNNRAPVAMRAGDYVVRKKDQHVAVFVSHFATCPKAANFSRSRHAPK
jgi:hypothetical protein